MTVGKNIIVILKLANYACRFLTHLPENKHSNRQVPHYKFQIIKPS